VITFAIRRIRARLVVKQCSTIVRLSHMSSIETAAPSKLKVDVLNNGITKTITYNPHEHGHALFEHACHAFGIRPEDRGELALYLPNDSTEVPPNIPVSEGGVEPDTRLVLRPRSATTG
jgi:hypothetical protein